MPEMFRETDKAVAYLSSGLQSDFPEATAELIHVARRRPTCVSCDIQHIGPILSRLCRKFPMATVSYHPENPYGFVAEIRSHGDKKPPGMRKRKKDRPRVMVLLTRVAGEDVILGSKRGHALEEGASPGEGH